LEAAWRGRRGCEHVKAGVLLDDLCPPGGAPPMLFGAQVCTPQTRRPQLGFPSGKETGE